MKFMTPADQQHSLQYRKYINSAAWFIKRDQVLLRANNRCEHCGEENTKLQVHHRHYRTLGKEKLNDLVCLCLNCHAVADDLRRIWSKPKL